MPARHTDLLFRNGTIFNGHAFLPPGTEVRVRDGRIISVDGEASGTLAGSPDTASGAPAAAPDTASATVIDLDGGTLLPGFIDAHAHPVFAGHELTQCDLTGATTVAEYRRIIADYVRRTPGDGWITGGGWSMEAFPGGVPTAADLDDLVSGRPVFLPNRDHHGAWVSTGALTLAGIDAATPDPADGRIERDARGNPVGALQEGAMGLVSRLIPAATEADWDRALAAAQARLLSFGITGWQDAIVGRSHKPQDPIPAYLRAANSGSLRVNVVGALWWDRHRGLEQLPELIEARRTSQAGRFRATTVKMMLDGVAENHTAAMLEPYLDGHGCATDGSGLDFIDAAELPRYVTALDREGFGVHFHALGDRAVRLALDAITAARSANGNSGLRHHLAHLQVIHPDDIPRFAQVGATANIQPLWAAHEPQMDELTIPFLGDRRAGWQYPFRALADSGAALCAGSDWPVSSPNPIWGAHVAVNRTVPPGDGHAAADAEPFLPEQRLDLATVLAAYTSGSARINSLEQETGSIRAGLDADFAVVGADLAHLAPHEIGLAAVTQTWIRGELAW